MIKKVNSAVKMNTRFVLVSCLDIEPFFFLFLSGISVAYWLAGDKQTSHRHQQQMLHGLFVTATSELLK